MPERHKETESAGWGWNASQTAYRVEYHGRPDRSVAAEMRGHAETSPGEVAMNDAPSETLHVVTLGATGVPAVDRAAGLALGIADREGAAGQPQDGDLAQIFDWATRTMDRTAGMAEEAVADRRRLIREMAARKRLIDHRLAKTSRALERLMAG